MALVLDGLAQTTGAILIASGMSSHTKVQVHAAIGRFVVVPAKTGTGYGLAASGRF